jgi:adenosylcobinamide-GDP ribazoletransferase
MLGALVGAFQFLTILPLRGSKVSPGRSAFFFPLVGAALGACVGLILTAFGTSSPTPLLGVVALTFATVITGGLHEDAIADVADAFRSTRSVDKIHSILKDSRIGAHGAMALILGSLLRWQALVTLSVAPVAAIAASFALGRASLVLLAYVARPTGGGLGFAFSQALTTSSVMGALSLAIVFAFLPGLATGVLLLGGTGTIVIACCRYFELRLGGVTGDCLGATGYLVETYCLILLACQSYT